MQISVEHQFGTFVIGGLLVGFDKIALEDSISVYIGLSLSEREKEK